MNRRSFLKKGLFGGALLAVGGGGGLALWPGRLKYVPTAPLAALTPRAFNVMAAICARVVGAPNPDPVALTQAIDTSLARAVPEARSDLVGVLHLLDNALAGLLDFRLGPFTALSPEQQDRVLLSWRDSRLVLKRGAYRALKNLATTSHYRQDAHWADAGYTGPPPWMLALVQAQNAAIEDEVTP